MSLTDQQQADYSATSSHIQTRAFRTISGQGEIPSSICNELNKKAIILSKTLHSSYLGPLIAGLNAQSDNPNPSLAAIAKQQFTSGQAHKDTQAESSSTASVQFKWDTWSETCGKSQAPWRPAPKQGDMGWGWWIAQDIGVEEWWTVPKAEGKDS